MTATAQANAADKADHHKEKGPSPFLRGVAKVDGAYTPTLALWAHSDDAKFHMHGYVGEEKSIVGFFNHDEASGRRSITLKKYVEGADGAEGKWQVVGFGNAVNTNKTGEPVYFDTVMFNVGDKTFAARVTKACDLALRDKIGFTSAQVERPAKQADGDAESEASSAPRARA